ncbi:MAG TPA: TIGR03960 family B12-binding radical SAM protein [Polyangiaceae bacterium]|nr:TIGR03960 family B12-binding radical SAM protein [Polyangiaceae bacterium]
MSAPAADPRRKSAMQLFEHPYSNFLQSVEKPTRYTGAEHGTRRKDWASVEARVCLAFPDIYDIGMSHLGFRMLYKILNDDERTLAERAYTPWVDMQRELLAHGKLLLSLESARPLCDFDVVGFSLQYELTYTNILCMLQLSGIPLRSAARSDDDPLIVAGGPVATHMEPMAIFLDAVLIGDGEEATTEIALSWVNGKKRGLSRAERLRELAQIRGVYVPSLYDTAVDPDTSFEIVTGGKDAGVPFPVERRLLADISKFPFPDDGPVGGPEAIFDRMSIEVARGCTEGCRFCQAGMIYRPVRERDPKEIIDTVLSSLAKSGQDEVSLTALSTADVSCISPLIKQLVEKTAPERVSLGVASLRAYGLAEDLLDDMRKVRASGLTFAPEAGTQRMRDVINKNVTEAQLMETAERVFSRGFDKMKLYFIIGLPTEEDEDVRGIVAVGKNALAVGKRVGKRPTVTVSVSTHVPKPHTPFQWCAQDAFPEVQRKQDILRDAASRVKGLKLRVHDSTASVLEGVLARGDRKLGPVIERAFLSGARFDSWDDQLKLEAWKEALAFYGIEIAPYLGTIPVTARLPWDHFDIGLEEGFLAREYRRALASRASPPCGKVAGMFVHHTNVADAASDARKLVCYDCGIACDMTKMRSERVEFLTELGATERRLPVISAPAPEPDVFDGSPEPFAFEAVPEVRTAPAKMKKKARALPEALRPVRSGGEPQRFRLAFTKTGPAALLGHLDLIRELPRVIRRAGTKTAYSKGFHPKPEMSFGPALSLGVASLDEYMDVLLIDAPEPDELLGRLNDAASGGLEFKTVVRLSANDRVITTIVTGARYVIALAESAVKDLGGIAGLERCIAEFLAKSECKLRRDIEGVGKFINVRQFVEQMSIGGDESLALLERAGLVGRMIPVDVTIEIGQRGSAKIAEVVEALTGLPHFPHRGVRTVLMAGRGTPLDLELFHKKPAAMQPAAEAQAQ